MKFVKIVSVLMILILSFSTGYGRKGNPGHAQKPSATMVTFAQRIKQGFDMRVWLSTDMKIGGQAWDTDPNRTPDGFGLEFPLGSGIEHLYGAGPWVGAIVNGARHVDEGYNGDDARTEFIPNYSRLPREHFWRTAIGSTSYDSLGYSGYYYINNMIVNRKGVDDDGDGKIDEDPLDGMDNDGDWNPLYDDVGSDGLPDSLEVSCNGSPYNPVTNPDPAFDNYDPTRYDSCHRNPDGTPQRMNNKDLYTEKNGVPDHGEPHVDEDYGAVSDNDLYCSATDTFYYPSLGGHFPIGAKVIQRSYAWPAGTSVDAIVVQDYSVVDLGMNAWQDAYVGFFADMDVGPHLVPAYYAHNYAIWDSVTRTAYIDNPVDTPSTPLGVTLLGTSRALDSLKTIFQWWDFTTRGLGTTDSVLYTWISCEAFAGQCVQPSQDPTAPSDTRFLISNGPFQVSPNDTVNAVYALVSGITVPEMLNNARRAHRIFEHGYFLMPVARIHDQGGGLPVTISWDPVEKSPYGSVTSYRVFYGKNTTEYTDSLTTDSLSVTFSGLTGTDIYHFAVAAIDSKGNESAFSDDLSTAPSAPSQLKVTNGQISILLTWTPDNDPDLAGYFVYRSTVPDTTFTRLNVSPLPSTSFTDSAVWGNRTYSYHVTAVDHDGHESPPSIERKGHLIPPAMPRNFVVGWGKTFLHLGWTPNDEADLAGYDIYKQTDSSAFVKLNPTPWKRNDFVDSTVRQGTIYHYYIDAVDTTDAVSDSTPPQLAHTARMDEGIMVINRFTYPLRDTAWAFYDWVLRNYGHTNFKSPLFVPPLDTLSAFSTALLFFEDTMNYGSLIWPYPLSLKGYLLGGGKLLVMGRRIAANSYPYWYQFLGEIFGIDAQIQLSNAFTFVGAEGVNGFPSVSVDAMKLQQTGGMLNYVERIPDAEPSRVVYTYHSNPFDSLAEGKAVGVRAKDSTISAYYLTFPLYYLDSASAQALITKILTNFGVSTGVTEEKPGLPRQFRLYDAFPNPFNPSTTIRFDLPAASHVILSIYDVLGKEVAHLVEGRRSAGRYELKWNAFSSASGVYFYRLQAGNFVQTKKLLLLR